MSPGLPPGQRRGDAGQQPHRAQVDVLLEAPPDRDQQPPQRDVVGHAGKARPRRGRSRRGGGSAAGRPRASSARAARSSRSSRASRPSRTSKLELAPGRLEHAHALGHDLLADAVAGIRAILWRPMKARRMPHPPPFVQPNRIGTEVRGPRARHPPIAPHPTLSPRQPRGEGEHSTRRQLWFTPSERIPLQANEPLPRSPLPSAGKGQGEVRRPVRRNARGAWTTVRPRPAAAGGGRGEGSRGETAGEDQLCTRGGFELAERAGRMDNGSPSPRGSGEREGRGVRGETAGGSTLHTGRFELAERAGRMDNGSPSPRGSGEREGRGVRARDEGGREARRLLRRGQPCSRTPNPA